MERMGWDEMSEREMEKESMRERKRGWEIVEGRRLVGGAFFIFPARSLLWVCIMWRWVMGLWSHQSCANRLAGKHVSPRGLQRWMCVLCESQMWDCVGNGFDGVKPILMTNRWGSWLCRRANLYSRARGEHQAARAFRRSHACRMQTYSSTDGFSMLHLHSLN